MNLSDNPPQGFTQARDHIYKNFQKWRNLRLIILNIYGLALQTDSDEVRALIEDSLISALGNGDYTKAKRTLGKIEELILMEKYPE